MMKVHDTGIPDLKVVEPKVFGDERGYFYECYKEDVYHSFGIDFKFMQDNISRSVKNTVRGLHYQVGEFAQGKLCQVIQGKVIDAAVDIRFGSPTFGRAFTVELSDENHFQLWIPPGFAHGFSVLSETAVFHYKCTQLYSKEHERAIYFGDSEIGIDWKVDSPVVSPKDMAAPRLHDIDKDFIYTK